MAIFESATPIELTILGLLIIIVVTLIYLVFRLIFRPFERYGWPFGRYGRPFGRYGWWRYDDYFAYLQHIINRAEDKAGIRLSWGAKEMLVIPVLESIESEGGVDWSEVEMSVNSLVSTIAAEDLNTESRRKTPPNSIALIWSFWKNFCNIPPFCSRKG